MSRELTVLLGGRPAGVLSQGEGGTLSFAYDDAYRESPDALPISLSLPLSEGSHAHRTVRAFCQGLLPDNEGVLERWGRDFQVSPGNPFALLAHVGEAVVALRSTLPKRLAAAIEEHAGACRRRLASA